MKKPNINSQSEKDLDKAERQIDAFENEIKTMTNDRVQDGAPDIERKTSLSQKEIANSKDIYLKPQRSISSPQKFNEKFRKSYEFAKEYVQFEAENKEIGGEAIEVWTRPYGGVNAEYWVVPVNKPVWGPRYLAEQLKRKYYHRLTMNESKITSQDGHGQYFGSMIADSKIQRLDAIPITGNRSVFMGAS